MYLEWDGDVCGAVIEDSVVIFPRNECWDFVAEDEFDV